MNSAFAPMPSPASLSSSAALRRSTRCSAAMTMPSIMSSRCAIAAPVSPWSVPYPMPTSIRCSKPRSSPIRRRAFASPSRRVGLSSPMRWASAKPSKPSHPPKCCAEMASQSRLSWLAPHPSSISGNGRSNASPAPKSLSSRVTSASVRHFISQMPPTRSYLTMSSKTTSPRRRGSKPISSSSTKCNASKTGTPG